MVSSGDNVGCVPEPVLFIGDGFNLQFYILQAVSFTATTFPYMFLLPQILLMWAY